MYTVLAFGRNDHWWDVSIAATWSQSEFCKNDVDVFDRALNMRGYINMLCKYVDANQKIQ